MTSEMAFAAGATAMAGLIVFGLLVVTGIRLLGKCHHSIGDGETYWSGAEYDAPDEELHTHFIAKRNELDQPNDPASTEATAAMDAVRGRKQGAAKG